MKLAAALRGGQVLVVGGSPAVALGCVRELGRAGHRVALLRWPAQATAADASRHCSRSIWIGPVDAGVARWRSGLEDLLGEGQVAALLPIDPLACALVGDGSVALHGVRLLGPACDAHASASDRLSVFAAARASGWRVPDWQHAARPERVPAAVLPCIVRPRWDLRILGDAPARFSTKRAADTDALDAKLRDDVPRGESLLQALPPPSTRRLCVAAQAGRVIASWPPAGPMPAGKLLRDRTEGLVARLGYTGLLEIEFLLGDDAPTLLDLRCGATDAYVRAAHAGVALAGALLDTATNSTPPREPRRQRPHAADPMPAIAAAGLLARDIGAKALRRVRAALWPLAGPARRRPRLDADMSVLLVCKGNINRSLVAEHLLRAAGFGSVASAGLIGLDGRRASGPAERFLCETLGIAPNLMRSQSLPRASSRAGPFDVALCFERRQAVELADRCPELRGRIHLFSDLAPELGGPLDIADPHGLPEAEYRRCFMRIRQIVQAALAAAPEPRRTAGPILR